MERAVEEIAFANNTANFDLEAVANMSGGGGVLSGRRWQAQRPRGNIQRQELAVITYLEWVAGRPDTRNCALYGGLREGL